MEGWILPDHRFYREKISCKSQFFSENLKVGQISDFIVVVWPTDVSEYLTFSWQFFLPLSAAILQTVEEPFLLFGGQSIGKELFGSKIFWKSEQKKCLAVRKLFARPFQRKKIIMRRQRRWNSFFGIDFAPREILIIARRALICIIKSQGEPLHSFKGKFGFRKKTFRHKKLQHKLVHFS